MADTPVTQTLTISKSGSNWSKKSEALADFKAAKTNASDSFKYGSALSFDGKASVVTKLVDNDTFQIIRYWKDWYDYEDYNGDRKTHYSNDGPGVWASRGWVITEDLSRT